MKHSFHPVNARDSAPVKACPTGSLSAIGKPAV
jgi:hypothetical protein